MKILTRAESRALDAMAIEKYGLSEAALMENAGRALAAVVDRRFSRPAVRRFGGAAKRAVVFCGHGNNGGDGLVAGRHLLNWGWRVQLFLSVSPDELRGETANQYETMRSAGAELESVSPNNLTRVRLAAGMCDVVIDALLGTGLEGELREPYDGLIELLRSLDVPVVSADVPSGLDADTGFPVGDAVRATVTVTFGVPKVGLAVYPGAELAGDVVVADIGLPRPALEGLEARSFRIGDEVVHRLMPRRSPDAHKGNHGRVLVVAGSNGMAGAAILCGRGALRGGAGLVTLAVPTSIQQTVAGALPEALTVGLPEGAGDRSADSEAGGSGAIGPAAMPELLRLEQAADAVVLGPGLSRGEETAETVADVLAEFEKPVVLDADALNIMAGLPGWGLGRRTGAGTRHGGRRKSEAEAEPTEGRTVMTPHSGELGRLLKKSADAVQHDRFGAVREAAERAGATVVLKGAHTLVGRPDGVVAVNPTGNPGMASGGSGDVLSGLLGAWIGRGLAGWEAALVAVYAHGLAGDLAAARWGADGMGALDIAEMIAVSVEQLRGQQHSDGVDAKIEFEPAAYRAVAFGAAAGAERYVRT